DAFTLAPKREFIEVVNPEKVHHISEKWYPIGSVSQVKKCLSSNEITGEDIVYFPKAISQNQSTIFNSNFWQFTNNLLD
ncbi:MAG: hypothetical protein GVY04_04840, partial [Cyanobacteria bacterium]|nr:hypothetical protein [Cyanobacteria bacterium GSL.Bin1]